jgi:hypothetical protein
MWNNHTLQALPCINTPLIAAKINTKDQQPLFILNMIELKNSGKKSEFSLLELSFMHNFC